MAENPNNLANIEEKWIKFWEKEKIYKFNPNTKRKIYSIDTPPPTVSGEMHMGHAYSYSQQDFIARFRRMNQEVFYPFGTDDNGLPTERLIEKLKNVRSKNMSRAEFVDLCQKSLKEITPAFVQDWKNLGISCDYDMHYSTIDKNSQRISQESFIELYKKEQIYKKEFPTIWCPECQTAIAQAELEDKKLSSLFSTLKFSCSGKDLLIATTRPELLPACVAVFVNPQDKRYKNLVGKKAKVPLFNYEVSIIADESAEMEKGTGVLMICSYGDRFDVESINKHKLTPNVILDKNGRLKSGDYAGLKIKEARKKILEDLKNKNLIAEQKEISHVVNVHDKCGTEIEFIPTEQWFVKILDKKKILITQGKKVKWYPDYMFKRYENWVNGLEWDWNISRDRYFGIPIPVWYCKKCGEIILPENKELPVDPVHKQKKCSKCGGIAEPETKVLDTWATSSLTPQIASSLTEGKIKIPYSLRPQAHDIIRTWAFYTITRAYLQKKEIPWENIMISGFVTLGGEKMSKSKGNVIKPQEIVKKYGADAMRFWAAGPKLGEDLDYQEKDLLTGKKFINKLLNASNFVFMNMKDYKNNKKIELEEMDRLFISQVNSLIETCTKSFENYEYSRVKAEIENFFWHIFCDNYLELVKSRVYNGTKSEKDSAFFGLYNSLFAIIKLIAPIMPFVTEEIYQTYFIQNEKDKSIHISNWPEKFKIKENKDDKKIFDSILEFNSKVWKEKKEKGLSLRAEISDISIPKDLKALEKDLTLTHNLKWTKNH
ncbi:Isoleucine--tRNA ligase [uncultured archaeon]|nr:Isoleucine--tRNA ligase [uncultured archaeon]